MPTLFLLALEPQMSCWDVVADSFPPLGGNYAKLFVANVDVLKDNEVEDAELSHSCCCRIKASNDAVEPYGLWLLMLRNPSDVVVEQDDVAVGLLLLLRLTCWPTILLLAVAAQPLMLSICTSPSLSLSL